MNDLIIGIVGMGMIGNSTAVLSTLHGLKTIVYLRNPQKAEGCLVEFDRMYQQMVDQQVISAEQAAHAKTYLNVCENILECRGPIRRHVEMHLHLRGHPGNARGQMELLQGNRALLS